jgi:hypothetical protein
VRSARLTSAVLVLVLAASVVAGTGLVASAQPPAAPPPAPSDDPPAETAYLNIDVLKGIPASRIPIIMSEWSRALGVKCEHCHVGEEFENASLDKHAVSKRMSRMATAVSASHLKAEGGVTCWSCHRGRAVPKGLPGDAVDAARKTWPEDLDFVDEDRKLTMTVYTVSLGVTCEHCHAVPKWADRSKPQNGAARRMATLFDEFPKHVPDLAGKMQCYSCHQGATKVEKAPPARARGPR